MALLQAQHAMQSGALALAPPGARLTIRDVHDRVAAAGYREISEIEWEDGHYEVEARDAGGQAVELQVSGDTGAIEGVQPQD